MTKLLFSARWFRPRRISDDRTVLGFDLMRELHELGSPTESILNRDQRSEFALDYDLPLFFGIDRRDRETDWVKSWWYYLYSRINRVKG